MAGVSSWNTAIKRNKPSSVVSALRESGLILGRVLDYGCGRGDDVSYLKANKYNVSGYDPHWSPTDISGEVYDTILCTYVLNVLSEEESETLIGNIKKHLAPNGKAYLSVRRDIKKDGKTSRGFQRNVTLNFPVITERKNRFCIYLVSA
jgi:ATP adenylyltransferase